MLVREWGLHRLPCFIRVFIAGEPPAFYKARLFCIHFGAKCYRFGKNNVKKAALFLYIEKLMNNSSYYYTKGLKSGGGSGGEVSEEIKQDIKNVNNNIKALESEQKVLSSGLTSLQAEIKSIQVQVEGFVKGVSAYSTSNINTTTYTVEYHNKIAVYDPNAEPNKTTDMPL